MSEKPDDWFEDLLDRENNPEFERPASIREEAADYAKDKVKDFAKDKLKEAGKKALKEAGKQGAEAGAEAAGSAAAGAAAGAGAGAASGAGATAVGAGVAASTGIETAGIGVAVGAAIAILGNKKTRTIAVVLGGFIALLMIALVLLTVLTPILIMSAVGDKALDVTKSLVDGRAAKFVAKTAVNGAKKVGNTAKDAVGWGVGLISYEDDTNTTVASATTNGSSGELTSAVLAAVDQGGGATGEDPNSRLGQLTQAMGEKGYFNRLAVNYGVSLETDNGKTFRIMFKGKLVKTVNSEAAVEKEFETNPDIRDAIQASMTNDLHVFDYSKRVTMAEKALANYKTMQLLIPGADSAAEDDQVTKVRQSDLETQNNPFLAIMKGNLNCDSCSEWIPDTSTADDAKLSDSISTQTGFSPKGTLYSLMKARIKADGKSDDPGFADWYHYVKEMYEKSKLTGQAAQNDEFIQAARLARKDQASRQWYHWQTVVDQYKAGKLTDKSASALFQNFANGQSSKAYHYLSGQTGGKEFKVYDKVNDNKDNVVKAVYDEWRTENPENAQIVEKIVTSNWISFLDKFGPDWLINKILNDHEKAVALESAFNAGSKIMLPVCDGSKSGSDFMNCMYAGAEDSARDIGISDYGFSGTISKEEHDKVANYSREIDSRVAAKQPLFQRLTKLDGSNSFARTLILQASIPMGSSDIFSSLTSYFSQLPSHLASLAVTSTNGSVLAAEDETTINNINYAGVKLSSIQNTPLSKTLDDAYGSVETCPQTTVNQENLCRSDESVYLALAAKFDLLPNGSTGTALRIASFNVLNGEAHADDSRKVGNCPASMSNHDCTVLRATRAAQIIQGGFSSTDANVGTTPIDVVGTQEMSETQLTAMGAALGTSYEFFPKAYSWNNGSPQTIFWRTDKFTKEKSGTYRYPYYEHMAYGTWVRLSSKESPGASIYVYNVHAASQDYDSQNGVPVNGISGGAAKRAAAAKAIVADIKSRVTDGTPVFVTGDFNSSFVIVPSRDPGITRDQLPYCILTNGTGLSDTYDIFNKKTGTCPTKKDPPFENIDHIFATNTVQVDLWEMVRDGLIKTTSDHPILVVDAVTAAQQTAGGGTPVAYKNPVYNGSTPDPGVIRGDDKVYHVYATGNVHLSSKDLVHWKKLSGGWNIKGSPHFDCNWAPDVAKVGSIYVMTWAGIPDCSSVGAISNTSAIRYATSASAGGPFQYGGTLTSQGYAIDPHLFVDDDGKTYLEFGGGVLYLVQVKLTGNNMSTVGATKTIFTKTSSPTIENGWIQKRGGWYYLFYSQGHWNKSDGDPEYSTKIARSKTVDGPYQPTAYRDLLSGNGPPFWGPGGGSLTTDDAGTDWFVYHAWYKGSRVLMIDPITYSGGWPVINGGDGPSSELRPNGPVIGTPTTPASNSSPTGGVNVGGMVWPIAKANWPQRSMPIAECGLEYSDGTVHTGIDISVPTGTPVYAAADATVTYKGGSYGAVIAKTNLKAPDGSPIYLNYQHMSSISVGTTMKQGQVIGRSGSTGASSAHLHFGVWKTGSFLGGHDSVSSTAGRATLSQMLHPMNYLPEDGRNVSECKKPYVVP